MIRTSNGYLFNDPQPQEAGILRDILLSPIFRLEPRFKSLFLLCSPLPRAFLTLKIPSTPL